MLMTLPPAILFMKVGFHGQETLSAIMQRKAAEEAALGVTFWGYGGTLCHPIKSVQPFGKICLEKGVPITVMMAVTVSKFTSEPTAARELSEDGLLWQAIHPEATVTASRYALVLRELRSTNVQLDLNRYVVANGPSSGKRLGNYIRGRVDKGVAILDDSATAMEPQMLTVEYAADLVDPYAVLIR